MPATPNEVVPGDVAIGRAASWQSTTLHPGLDILPDGCVDIVHRDDCLWVVGPMKRPRRVALSGPTAGLRLAPGQARRLLGVSPKELIDAVVPCAELPGPKAWRSLDDAKAELAAPSVRVREATALLQRPGAKVEGVAKALGIGPRQLRRLFEDEVGLGPRSFASIRRFQRFVALPELSLGAAAAAVGCADQAHLSREVKRWSGLSPKLLRHAIASGAAA